KQYCTYITRMKLPCAFDDPELHTYENDLFGSETADRRHFTPFGREHSRCGGECAPEDPVFLMNAMNFTGQEGCAQHWRIRHGAADRDTAFAIPVLLAECLRNAGKTVDFRLPWGVPHSGDYDLPELFAWIDRICR
ncbi:MAG: alpha/beta hydrolase, partial [Clostridia bacterium]|nr:alpha/beta hydrolase [Clostridia bacterium]